MNCRGLCLKEEGNTEESPLYCKGHWAPSFLEGGTERVARLAALGDLGRSSSTSVPAWGYFWGWAKLAFQEGSRAGEALHGGEGWASLGGHSLGRAALGWAVAGKGAPPIQRGLQGALPGAGRVSQELGWA